MNPTLLRALLYKVLKQTEQLRVANQLKSDFLANLSYELRTPLTSIIGIAQMLTMDFLLPNQQKQIADILSASEHMLSLVNELLDLSKLEIGKIELKPEVFNLRILLSEIIDILSFHAHAKGLQFALDYATTLPELVFADIRLVRQIALNLLSRALQNTDQGSVILKVTHSNYETLEVNEPLHAQHQSLISTNEIEKKALFQEGATIQNIALTVLDTGAHLEKGSIDQINAYLSQAEHFSTRHYTGIDLSLMIAISHLKLIRARVEIETRKETGTCIRCHIPFHLAAQPTTLNKATPKSSYFTPFNRKLRILLVEDDYVIQTVYKTALHKMHCTVDVANNAKTALEFYNKYQYDAILMDIGLPEKNGIAITKQIRQLERNRLLSNQHRTPILALTAHGLTEDTQKFLEAGIDEVIIKPIPLTQLGPLIAKWVQAEDPQSLFTS